MKFSIIHASYGRYQMAMNTCNRWVSALTINPDSKRLRDDIDFEYLFSVDKSDSEFHLWENILNDPVQNKSSTFKIIVNETNTSVAAINNAANKCTGDIIIVTSDDFEPIWQWDQEILKVVGDRKDWILKTRDGIQNWIITLPIMDRTYYNRFGYIYHPDYKHMFCDTELTCVADLLGRKIKSDLFFKHNHYSVGGSKDKTSEKADATWRDGELTFSTRAKARFDILTQLGTIEDQATINWMRRHYINL